MQCTAVRCVLKVDSGEVSQYTLNGELYFQHLFVFILGDYVHLDCVPTARNP